MPAYRAPGAGCARRWPTKPVVVIVRPQGPAVLHAMPMRTKYRRLLPSDGEVTVNHGKRAHGTPITDEVVEAMAAQAEQGYDVQGTAPAPPAGPFDDGSAVATVDRPVWTRSSSGICYCAPPRSGQACPRSFAPPCASTCTPADPRRRQRQRPTFTTPALLLAPEIKPLRRRSWAAWRSRGKRRRQGTRC